MQASDTARETHAKTPAAGTLALVTSLGALDGTLVLLAAGGALSTWSGAVGAGLTVIAGAGAWIAAHQAYGGRRRTGHDYAVLGVIALATSLATVLAAWLGGHVGASVSFLVLPRVAGLALLLVALEVGGFRTPRLHGAPLPAVVTLGGLLLEGVAQWTL